MWVLENPPRPSPSSYMYVSRSTDSADLANTVPQQRNLKAFAVPTLTVVPSHVVLQWAEEIQTITREFHIHLYYGSTAKAKGKDQYDIIEGGNLNIVAL
ncbi:hypothetical protein ZTR_07892 [Talaromyces verruculosus]|nr:hypothetical protein ZTR_07892 [Talaromyces verruculosus]